MLLVRNVFFHLVGNNFHIQIQILYNRIQLNIILRLLIRTKLSKDIVLNGNVSSKLIRQNSSKSHTFVNNLLLTWIDFSCTDVFVWIKHRASRTLVHSHGSISIAVYELVCPLLTRDRLITVGLTHTARQSVRTRFTTRSLKSGTKILTVCTCRRNWKSRCSISFLNQLNTQFNCKVLLEKWPYHLVNTKKKKMMVKNLYFRAILITIFTVVYITSRNTRMFHFKNKHNKL